MSAITAIMLPAVAGIGLGTLYFGGLWLTLRRLLTSRQPALLTLGSYLGRLSFCLLGFVLIARFSDWQGLLVCLVFFTLVRLVIVRRWGALTPALDAGKQERSRTENGTRFD